jgi:hypothetical protein
MAARQQRQAAVVSGVAQRVTRVEACEAQLAAVGSRAPVPVAVSSAAVNGSTTPAHGTGSRPALADRLPAAWERIRVYLAAEGPKCPAEVAQAHALPTARDLRRRLTQGARRTNPAPGVYTVALDSRETRQT